MLAVGVAEMADRFNQPFALARSPLCMKAKITTSRPCTSSGRNGSGGALRRTAQTQRSSGMVSTYSR